MCLLSNAVQRWYSAELYIRRGKSWKTKLSKRNFHKKVENMKEKVKLILDYVNRLSNNRAKDCKYSIQHPQIRTYNLRTCWAKNFILDPLCIRQKLALNIKKVSYFRK